MSNGPYVPNAAPSQAELRPEDRREFLADYPESRRQSVNIRTNTVIIGRLLRQ